MITQHFTATKAFIRRNNQILIIRESSQYVDGTHVGRYDVPGGRLDPNESIFAGLAREIAEETGLIFKTGSEFFSNDVVVTKQHETWHITRHYFICDIADGDVVLGHDHDDFKWINPAAYAAENLIDNLGDVFKAYLAHAEASA